MGMTKITKREKEIEDKYYNTNKELIDKKWKEIAEIQECGENYRRCKEELDYFKEMVSLAPNLFAIIYEFVQKTTIDDLIKMRDLSFVIEPDIYSWDFFTTVKDTDFIYHAMSYVIGKSNMESAIDYYNDYASSTEYTLGSGTSKYEYDLDTLIDKYVDFVGFVLSEEAKELAHKLSYAQPVMTNKYNNRYSLEEYVQYIDLGNWMFNLFIIPYYTDEERRKILERNNKKSKMERKLNK